MTTMGHLEGQQQNKKPEMKKGVTSVAGINIWDIFICAHISIRAEKYWYDAQHTIQVTAAIAIYVYKSSMELS